MNKKVAIIGILIIILIGVLTYLNPKNQKASIGEQPTKEIPTFTSSEEKIKLREDGIGIFKFGTSAEEALSVLTPIMGEPTKDTGWVDSFSTYGTCPGDKIRGIEWDNLHLMFGDTSFGNKAFFGFEYVNKNPVNQIILKTEKGITLGATKEEIKIAYPTATFGAWLPGQEGTTFIRGKEGSREYLGGTIEENKLFWIGGGILCGE